MAAESLAPNQSAPWALPGRELMLGGCPRVMGIVNVTPDSFSDGGTFLAADHAVAHGLRLLDEGADLLDIGGESTRPGAEPVSADAECERVMPVVKGILRARPDAVISVDTTKARVAEAALEAGALIVNDVSGGRFDPEMFPLAARTGAGLVIMHMRGTPRTMQDRPVYDDVVAEVAAFFRERLTAAAAAGVRKEAVVFDPGIGFGKTLEHNLDLMANLPALSDAAGRPLLLGVSRKRWVGEITGRGVGDRLAGSLGGLAACVEGGAKILRVHDVLSSCDVVRVLYRIRQKQRQ
ncbi:MAG: dihydropteroate synthase [Kiritimatiellae bacterium]|nr:dihydropteroate synthase [Kiritimatiellia bacterium]